MTFASPVRFRACLLSVLAVATIGPRSGTLYRRLLLTSAVAFVLLACSRTGVAQKDAGAIAGVARDASGAVIAGVSVTATDVDHGTAVTVSSNGWSHMRDTPGFGFLAAAQAPRQIQFSLKLTH